MTLRCQAVLASPRCVPGSAWEELLSRGREPEMQLVRAGVVPSRSALHGTWGVVASLRKGPSSRFQGHTSCVFQQPAPPGGLLTLRLHCPCESHYLPGAWGLTCRLWETCRALRAPCCGASLRVPTSASSPPQPTPGSSEAVHDHQTLSSGLRM